MSKRILILLMALASALVLLASYDAADYQERQQRAAAIEGLGTTFSVPDEQPANDPSVFWPILERAAVENGANVFRKADGWGLDDKPFTSYYVLLTSDETGFYDAFRLSEGRFLGAADAQDGSLYLSSEPADDPNQVGVIEDVGRNNSYSIYGMEAAFDAYPVAGTYVVEAQNAAAREDFLASLESQLAAAGASAGPEDLSGASLDSTVYGEVGTYAASALWMAVVAVVVMIIFRQLNEAKRAGVLLLHGYGLPGIWFRMSGRLVVLVMAVLVALGFLAGLLIPGSTVGLAADAASGIAGMALLFVAASFLAALFAVRRTNVGEALKNRRDTLALAVLNLVAKGALCVLLVFMGAAGVGTYLSAQGEKERLGNWERTSQYGIFYPLSAGLDLSDQFTSTVIAKIALDLYPALNEEGAIFVRSVEYASYALSDGLPGRRSIRVNPNYLRAYPVLDADGNPVSVTEDEADWVLLVPESLRSEEDAILERWSSERMGDGGMGSVREADEAFYGRTVDEPKPDQGVKIIWTATGQQVFSFNPEVFPENANNIEDPIIEVMTTANSAGVDRADGVNGGLDANLKVKLDEGGAAKTYERLVPLLRKLGLDDNLQHLVTLDDAVYTTLQGYYDVLRDQIFQMAMTFAIFLVLALQSVPLLFELDARRVAARKLYGYPFLVRQRRFFAVFACTWACVFLAAMAFDTWLGWRPPGIEVQDMGTLLAVAAAFMAVEAAVSAAALWFVESRRVGDVLKGEF